MVATATSIRPTQRQATTKPGEIVWENPPEQSSRLGILADMLRQIKLRPHEWARIRVYTRTSSVDTARLRIKFPDFEFVTRRIPEGRGLYAKYSPTS